MEALFATAATNRRLVPSDSNYPSSGGSSCGRGRANSTEQVSLLEPRKSHNIAIVLRSLAVGWDEVIDALRDGHAELSADVLEKLGKLNVSKDEASAILRFSGDTDGLAPAESFVFRLLLDVRDPFARIEALHFRASYGAEAARLRQSLQTLELASQEMRTKGLFYKLLEAVLKAGNRMNAGTARGNAQAFNLAALCKLSDVKSTDGITTLLHFVVEEVVRAEGKRRAFNRTHSLGRSGSLARAAASDDGGGPAPGPTREERQNEYMNVGLPVVRGLGAEFANVKSAASVDYDAVVSDIIELGRQLGDIKKIFDTCEDDNEDGFTRVMRGFAKNVEEELMALKEEQERVQELVRRTTEYYHAGATNDKSTPPLQLFVVVRDFLDMVDKACVDINRKLQQKKPPPPSPSQQPTTTTAAKVAVQEVREGDDSRKKRVMPRFPNLPARFLKDSAESDSSSDED